MPSNWPSKVRVCRNAGTPYDKFSADEISCCPMHFQHSVIMHCNISYWHIVITQCIDQNYNSTIQQPWFFPISNSAAQEIPLIYLSITFLKFSITSSNGDFMRKLLYTSMYIITLQHIGLYQWYLIRMNNILPTFSFSHFSFSSKKTVSLRRWGWMDSSERRWWFRICNKNHSLSFTFSHLFLRWNPSFS